MRSFRIHLYAGVAVLFTSIGTMSADLSYSNKWRIQCSGGAESNGTIQLRIAPERGQATLVTVNVAAGRSENGVARDIREALQAQLPRGTYDIETDDGEDVLIKKNFYKPDFALEVVSSTVDDVRLNLDRE